MGPWALDSSRLKLPSLKTAGALLFLLAGFNCEYYQVTAAALSQGYGYILFGYNTWGVYFSLLDILPKPALVSCWVLFVQFLSQFSALKDLLH